MLSFVQAFLVFSVVLAMLGVLFQVPPESVSRARLLWCTGGVGLLSLIWSVAQYVRAARKSGPEEKN